MSTSIRRLRNELTADTTQYVRALSEAERAAEALGSAQADLGRAVEQTDKKTTRSAAGLEAVRRQIDPLYAAQERLRKSMGTLQTARDLEKIDDAELARLKKLLTERYDLAGQAAARAAKAQADAAKASAAAAAAEQAGLQRLRSRYDEAYGAAERYNTALAEVNTLQRAGVLAGQSLAEAYAKVERELNPLNLAIAKQQAELKAAQAAAAAHAAALDTLRGKYDADYAAATRYNAALREVNELERAGTLTGASLAAAKDKIERELNPLNVALEKERQQMTALLSQLDPTRAASVRLAESEALLSKALAAGTITGAEHTRMLRQLRTQAGDTSDGVQLAGHQITNLSFQLQDAAVQLQMGTNPFTILMQQGPQAVGAVGGVANAASLMGTALRAVVSPAGLAVAGVVALGAAGAVVAARVAQINAELRRTQETLRALNPDSSLTAAGVRQSSFDIAAQRGVSRSDASSALAATMRNRNLSGGMATQIAGVGQDLAAVLGIDPAEAAAKLAEAFSKGAAGIRELDKELGFLSVEQARSIRLMEEQGNRAGALNLAMQALEQRAGGAAKNMQSEWGKAFSEMGKTFDQFLERLANSSWSKGLADAAASAARGWRSILGGDTDISADIVAANKQLIAAMDALKRLEQARASGSGMVNDRTIEQQAARVNALRQQVDELIERQQSIASQTAFGGGPIVDPPRPGMTDDERKAIDEKRAALERETRAMQGNAAERSIRLAGIQAEQAALDAGATAEAAHEERLIAEARARQQLAVASSDQLTAMALETKQLMELADAYQISKEAVAGQLAVNEAETAAANGQTQAQNALKQALLERAAARAQVTGAQQLEALRDEVRLNKELAAAALIGAAAEEEVARQNKVRLFSEQVLTAAVKSGRQDMIDAAEVEIRKYDQLTAAAQKANRERAFNVSLRGQRESLEIQQKEFELVSAMPAERAREIAILEATNRLKAMGKDITTEEGQEYIRNAALIAEQGTKLAEVQRITQEATDNIVEAFTSMGEEGKNAFEDLKNFALRMLKEIAAQAVIRPIIQPIVASAVGSIMGGTGGSAAGGSAAGGSGITGMAMNAAGSYGMNAAMGSMMGAGGTVSSLMGTTLVQGTTTGAITQSGSLAAAYTAPGASIAGSAGGVTVGSALGAGAAGAAVGGIVGSMVGNATQSRAIGAGTGALTGAAAGFLVGGPVGAVIGAVGGALMAALGTSGKPSNKEGNATYDIRSGRTIVGGQEGDKFSQENRDAASGTAGAYGSIANMMGGFADQRIDGRIRVVMGDRDGISGSFNDAKFSWPKRNADAIGDMTEWFVAQFAAQLGDTLPGDVRTALQRIDWKDVESALADLNFAGTFRDSLKALRGDFGLTDEATKAAKEEVRTLTDQIISFKAQTQRLGLDTAEAADATRSYVEGLLGMRQVAPAMNATEEAVEVLRVRFAAMAPLLAEVGISADEAGKGFQRALNAMRDDFVKGLDREFNELSGAGWVNQIDDTFAVLADRLRSAAALGGGSDQALRNNHAAITNILAELENPQLDEAAARYGGAIASIAQAIKDSRALLGDAAPAVEAAVLDSAKWFADLMRQLNDLSGAGYINQISDQFAALSANLAIAAQVGFGSGEALAANHLSMVKILEALSDDQLGAAAERFGEGIRAIADSIRAGRLAVERADFASGLAREGNDLSGAGYVNSINDQFARMADQLATAQRVGVGYNEVLSNNHMSMTRILSALTDDQLRDAAARFEGGIRGIAESLIAGRAATVAATAAQEAAAASQQRLLDAANERVDRAREAVQSAYQREIDAQEALADAARNTGDNMRRFAGSFRNLRQELLAGDLSPLSPEARYQQARSSFNEIAGKAAAGDADAMAQLEQAAQSFLQASRGYYASGEAYAQDFSRVQQALTSSAASADSQASAADQALGLATQQRDLLRAQLDAINGTTTATLSIGQAMAQLSSALLAQAAAGGGGSGAGAGTVNGIDLIGAAYQQYLGRDPEASGRASWQSQLSAGGSISSVITGIAGSDEAFIRSLYTGLLGREPDAGGMTTWGNALKAGVSRAEVERMIKASPEGKAKGYEAGGVVINGRWNQDSVTALLAGGEYVTKAPSVNPGTLGTLAHINRTGSLPANDTGQAIRGLRDETRRQTAALQEGFIRLLKLTERQTSDIADLRAAQRRKAAS